MNTIDLFDAFEQEIIHCSYDLKAEPQLALALDYGLSIDDLFITCDGFFHRPYSRDVLAATRGTDAIKKEFTELHLSRTGIYDQLPEGLFYDHTADEGLIDIADMAAMHKTNRKKEQVSRRFFMPLENEFLRQRIALEKEESRLLEGFQSGVLNDYLIDFWNIPPSLPKKYAVPLMTLIPYAHRIAGNIPLTEECLHEILREPVTIKKKYAPAKQVPRAHTLNLGEQELGIDIICGERLHIDYPALEITIGPLRHATLKEYLEGGDKEALMNVFYRFFIPAYTEVTTIIELEKTPAILHTEAAPVLGYSSVL